MAEAVESEKPLSEITSWEQAQTLVAHRRKKKEVISPPPKGVGLIRPSDELRTAIADFDTGLVIATFTDWEYTYSATNDAARLVRTVATYVTGQRLEQSLENHRDQFDRVARHIAKDALSFSGAEIEELPFLISADWQKHSLPVLRENKGTAHFDNADFVRYLWTVGPDQTRFYAGIFPDSGHIDISAVEPTIFDEGEIVRFYPTTVHEAPEEFDVPRLVCRAVIPYIPNEPQQ